MGIPNGTPAPPVTAYPVRGDGETVTDAVLELADGTAFRGISFGAEGKSIAGECVFQTGKSHCLPFFSTMVLVVRALSPESFVVRAFY